MIFFTFVHGVHTLIIDVNEWKVSNEVYKHVAVPLYELIYISGLPRGSWWQFPCLKNFSYWKNDEISTESAKAVLLAIVKIFFVAPKSS
jgi:hypothetical protein